MDHTPLLGQQAYKKYFPNKDYKEFCIGNLFPDIRYLCKLDRGATHMSNKHFEEIVNEPNSFTSGVMFHSFADTKTKEFRNENFLNYLNDLGFGLLALLAWDMVGDRWMHKYTNTKTELGYLNHFCEEEFDFGIAKKHIHKWHTILTGYISNPSTKSLGRYASSIYVGKNSLTRKDVSDLAKIANTLKKNIKTRDFFLDYIQNFDEIIQKDLASF